MPLDTGGGYGSPPKPPKPKPKPAPSSPPQPTSRQIEARRGGGNTGDTGSTGPGQPKPSKIEVKKGGGNTTTSDNAYESSGTDDKKAELLSKGTVSPKTGKPLSASGNVSTTQGQKADKKLTGIGGGGRPSGGGRKPRPGGGLIGGFTRGGSTFTKPGIGGGGGGGGATGGFGYHEGERKDNVDIKPPTQTDGSVVRVGGGFSEVGTGFRGTPAYFDAEGGGVGGGGQTGGATNPLASSVSSAFSQSSLEEVLHGNKKKGRAKRSRRTE